MKDLKFTVIIPTRERLSTLRWSIKTLTTQRYNNLEIIVSDNDSQDGTGDYVNSLNDNRIKYVNTGVRVSMTENWEFSLKHASGDFVTFIGDDDGLALGALERCNELLNGSDINAFVWKKAGYIWDRKDIKCFCNTVELPTSNDVLKINAKEAMEKIITFKKHNEHPLPAYYLPCIYNAFIRKDIIDEAKEKQGGKLFHSRYPDIYSAFLLPFFIDSYIFSFRPIGVNGASVNSNGNSTFLFMQNRTGNETERFMKENAIDIHPRLIFSDLLSAPFIMMESYLQVCTSLQIEPILFDVERLSRAAIRHTEYFYPDSLPWTLKSIQETCKVNNVEYTMETQEIVNIKLFQRFIQLVKSGLLSLALLNRKEYLWYLRSFRKKDIYILDPSYPQNILGACQLVGEKLGYI